MGFRLDGFANLLTKLGLKSRDKRKDLAVTLATVFYDRDVLDELYAGEGLLARIIDLPPDEMTREWIELQVGDDDGADQAKAMLQALDDLDIQSKVNEGLKWGWLYGGAVMILGLDDGLDPSLPLNEDNIRSLNWVTVLDRFSLRIHQRVTDPFARNYSDPEVYQLQGGTEGAERIGDRIHASRVIRFPGAPTSLHRQRTRLEGWDDSVVTRIYEALTDFSQSWGGAAHLMTDMAQAVYKMDGLAQMLASDQEDLVLKRIEALDKARSVVRALLIDAEHEEFTREPTPLTGLPDVMDRLLLRVSGEVAIPITLLFGRSPAGENATGDADIRFFYDRIKSDQERKLRPRLGRIISLLWRAQNGPTGGREPEEWSLEFRPLWQLDEMQEAELRKRQAETDAMYLDRGVVDPSEIGISRFGGDRYSTETVLDMETREAARQLPDELPEPLPGDEPPEPEGGPQPGVEDVQKTALNGAQIQAMQAMLQAVADGQLPSESAVEALRIGFRLTDQEARSILSPLDSFEQRPKPSAPPPFGEPPPDEEDEEDEDEEA